MKTSKLMLKNWFLVSICMGFISCTHAPMGRELSSFSPNNVKNGHEDFVWVEYGPHNNYVIRSIPSNGDCPKVLADSREVVMRPRNVLRKEDFSENICEAQVPRSVLQLKVGEKIFSLLHENPKRILVVGDSGCQIKSKAGKVTSQNCNSETEWPFAKVAKSAANWKPDLVIHVGDYHYREVQCDGNDKCSGAISGDNLQSWIQDFFAPAQPLLETVPWIFVRGNHELCERGGFGWFNLLSPNDVPDSCIDQTDPYSVSLGDHEILVVDSATDVSINPSLAKLSINPDRIHWLLLHRPFLTPGADDETTTQSELSAGLEKPGSLSFVLTGHQHHVSLNTFNDFRPPELISGNGGTALEVVDGTTNTVGVIKNADFISRVYSDFGFMTFERLQKAAWRVIIHDRNGKNMMTCRLLESLQNKTQLECPAKL